ncbi:hypothetical protein METBIDRAFT_32344 [Metschnikowia bicuspidata var. bicuspidata NRRL YB-4993]|uniref:Uncharacterized protein n=1 Tax=Metschnikowia bicuspidata var. bicuspidata NRRL YB-4993 TaxID=869754 RepID=A0A1A0H8X2_9ASCO|nr:hypothetical protein METBIDRAFT_32344 [Metschnikowia bicuspidata var. bicuspidata NRRL YB-4993]OBA20332.1 hypothetical protein METBIDRAFT_32344 [Metschnikowia bicuspidata var. bicuspidata NRRL YB-4993]
MNNQAHNTFHQINDIYTSQPHTTNRKSTEHCKPKRQPKRQHQLKNSRPSQFQKLPKATKAPRLYGAALSFSLLVILCAAAAR